jgi:hypothetical protein
MAQGQSRIAVFKSMVTAAALIALCPVAITAIGQRAAQPSVAVAPVAAVLTSSLVHGSIERSAVPDVTTAAACTVADFDQAAGKATSTGFTRVECAQGWGLAAGPKYLDLFRQKLGRWAVVGTGSPDGLAAWTPGEFAGIGISPTLLEQLARPFWTSVLQLVNAGALADQLANHETALKATGSYLSSPVVRAGGQAWFVLSGADTAESDNPSAGVSPYPDGTVTVYRWLTAGWTKQGAASGYVGPIGGCCGIAAVFLTGSHDPDFALTGGGAADTLWLSIVSDVSGHWQLVPFEYGYSDSTVVNGDPAAHGVYTEVDASSSATGPTTGLYETYQSGAFRPAKPPGASPPCSLSALQMAADPGELEVLDLTKFACADGWALAEGTGAGFTGQVVGLFNADKSNWSVVELDNGNSLGSFPGIYDIPLSLLQELAAGLGPQLRPALATASLVASPAMGGYLYVDGVITADGAQWYIAERPVGSAATPGADASVYRWSGTAWVKQGQVDKVPVSLNYFQAPSGGWFEAVSFPGTAAPAFTMQGSSSLAAVVLTDAGGTWHVAPFPSPAS